MAEHKLELVTQWLMEDLANAKRDLETYQRVLVTMMESYISRPTKAHLQTNFPLTTLRA